MIEKDHHQRKILEINNDEQSRKWSFGFNNYE